MPYEWNPFFDVISYNSLVGGYIIVFQTFTLSNWSDLMYMTMVTPPPTPPPPPPPTTTTITMTTKNPRDLLQHGAALFAFQSILDVYSRSSAVFVSLSQDVGGFMAVPYFIVLVMVGSFLMPNMLIAILKAKYDIAFSWTIHSLATAFP